MLIKDRHFRDNPPNPNWQPGMPAWNSQDFRYSQYRPEVHGILRMMRKVIDEYPDRVLIGELYAQFEEQAVFYGDRLDECHLPFNFWLIMHPWQAGEVANAILDYERSLPEGAWPNWVLGNHDQSRIASRLGTEQARVAAMLLLTLRGSPTLYYGDELGLEDVGIPDGLMVDPAGRENPSHSRDPERTPTPWDGSAGHGFTTGHPWLPIGDQAATKSVERECESPNSMLALYRQLLLLRSSEPALSVGDYGKVWSEGDVLAYERIDRDTGRTLLVALNLGGTTARIKVDACDAEVMISTNSMHGGEFVSDVLTLAGNEGVVIRL